MTDPFNERVKLNKIMILINFIYIYILVYRYIYVVYISFMIYKPLYYSEYIEYILRISILS